MFLLSGISREQETSMECFLLILSGMDVFDALIETCVKATLVWKVSTVGV